MSKIDSKIHWRLNDLLRAGKKAKDFAAVSWASPSELISNQFVPWQPLDVIKDEDHNPLDSAQTFEGGSEKIAGDEEISLSEIEKTPIFMAAIAKAKEKAFSDGFSKGNEEAETKHHNAIKAIQNLIGSLQSKQNNMEEFYDPLKKLALHIAKELVRGELSSSEDAIHRLASQALEDIEGKGAGDIVITLHPIDEKRLRENLDKIPLAAEIRGDTQMIQGSVRVTMGDSTIEDFIDHRLDAIEARLFSQPTENKMNELTSQTVSDDSQKEDTQENIMLHKDSPEQSAVDASEIPDEKNPDE